MRKSPQQIEAALIQRGLESEDARGIVRSAMQGMTAMRAEVSTGAQRNMVVGGIVCLIGSAVTFGTYQTAVNNPGGGQSYVVAWGAIVFGAAQFFAGLVQFMRSPRS